jgi:hypothetical protein
MCILAAQLTKTAQITTVQLPGREGDRYPDKPAASEWWHPSILTKYCNATGTHTHLGRAGGRPHTRAQEGLRRVVATWPAQHLWLAAPSRRPDKRASAREELAAAAAAANKGIPRDRETAPCGGYRPKGQTCRKQWSAAAIMRRDEP